MAEPIQYINADGEPLYASSAEPLPVAIAGAEITIDTVNVPSETTILNTAANPVPVVSGLAIPLHDYSVNSYVNSNYVTQTIYKVGGASGTIVATVDYTYDANTQKLLTTTLSVE